MILAVPAASGQARAARGANVRSPTETQPLDSQWTARQFGNAHTDGACWGGNWGGDFRADGGREFGGGSFASARGGFGEFRSGRR
jgi:hypothetical protein